MNELRAVTCPACKNRTDRHLFCDTCFGSRMIVLTERPKPVNLSLLKWGVFLIVAASVLLYAIVGGGRLWK